MVDCSRPEIGIHPMPRRNRELPLESNCPIPDSTPQTMGTEDIAVLQGHLIKWFTRHKRPMPWRETRDPYAILVSEMMLQQTTVATVRGYFERFMSRFPDWTTLAEASEEAVLAFWAGLGYYRRARLLQAAARQVVRTHGGRFPKSIDEAMALPGVGRYTAGAVLSFAHGLAVPIVETNSARVLSRLFAIRGPIAAPAVQKSLWVHAETLVPIRRAREYNYALMELGALICQPRQPSCLLCPIADACRAYREGLTGVIPEPTRKPEVLQVTQACAIVQCRSHYLMRQIPEGEWHAGLYEFPKVHVSGPITLEEQRGELAKMLACELPVSELHPIGNLRYSVTRHRITMSVWRTTAPSRRLLHARTGWRWFTLKQIQQLPLGSAQRRVLEMIASGHAQTGRQRSKPC